MPKYVVDLERKVLQRASFEVEAESDAAARRAATRMVFHDGIDLEWNDSDDEPKPRVTQVLLVD